ALPLQDDIVVGERLAAVLPGRDSPAQLILVTRQVERHIVLWAALKQFGTRYDFHGLGAHRTYLQCNTRPGGLRIDSRQGLVEASAPPAPEIPALEQHLGRVDERRALQLRELSLPCRKLAFGVRILPADVVPVIDMQRQRHHALRHIAAGAQAREPTVRWRAAAAALRGIELDQRHGALPAQSAALPRLGGVRQKGCEQRGCDTHEPWSKCRPAAYGLATHNVPCRI